MGRTVNTCLYELLLLTLEDRNIKSVLEKQEISSIAIYGLGLLGKSFYKTCINNGITVLFGMDKNENAKIEGLNNVNFREDEIPKVDAIVITPMIDIDEIRDYLQSVTKDRIIHIGELLDELLVATSIQ